MSSAGHHRRHFSWRKVHYEKSLFAFDLARICSLLFHPSQNGAPVVAEADFERDQLLRIGTVSHGQNCANTHVDLVKNVWRDRLLDLRGFHLTILSSQVSLIIPA